MKKGIYVCLFEHDWNHSEAESKKRKMRRQESSDSALKMININRGRDVGADLAPFFTRNVASKIL